MNPYEHEDAAEQWLDEALKNYSRAGCRPGLENRILATLEARTAQRQRRWVLTLAVASAVVLVAGMMSSLRPVRETVPAKNVWMKPKPAEAVRGAPNAAAYPLKRESAKPVRHATRFVFRGQSHRLSEQLVLEKGKSFLIPVHHVEPEPLIALQRAAPEIRIQDLGVRPIRVEELTPIRDMN